MITEQYVSLQTAILLKRAGFDERCYWDYYETGVIGCKYKRNSELPTDYYSRPTHDIAARWLREVHKICLILTPMTDGWMYDLYDLKKYQYIILSKDAGIVTYEAAFEEALQEALQLIIKDKGQ